MYLQPISDQQKNAYNKLVTHVMQSWQWGEFRKSLGTPVLRYGLYQNNKLTTVFQLTTHKIPFTNLNVGYLPKGPFPNKDLANALIKIGQENNCAFIKIEPNIEKSKIKNQKSKINPNFKLSPKPLFTKYNFILDLTKSEEDLLKNMHPKFRYNIKVAQKHGVWVEERTDDEALGIYLKLYFETTKRQGYHGHDKNYHRLVWHTLKEAGMARFLIAFYAPPASTPVSTRSSIRGGQRGEPSTSQKIPFVSWMLLVFKDTLYYPYGGSSHLYKNVMASNLVAWEAIKLGKKLGLKKFDLWGALGSDASPKDPWQGFHRFKQQLGGNLVEYIGTYDLVFNRPIYLLFTAIDKFQPLKVFLLKLLGKA